MQKYTVTVLLILLTIFSTGSPAQQTQGSATKESKSLTALKKQMRSKELEFYNAFNQLTQFEEYKVTCKTTKRHGASRLKTRVCAPSFFNNFWKKQRTEDLAESKLDFDGMTKLQHFRIPQVDQVEFGRSVKKKSKAMEEHIMALVQQHPQLMKKLMAYNESKKAFYQAKANTY